MKVHDTYLVNRDKSQTFVTLQMEACYQYSEIWKHSREKSGKRILNKGQ